MPRQSLGRGLSALLGDEAPVRSGETYPNEIDIDLIDPNPEQPRIEFNEIHLEELAASIRANGIVQPIVVRSRDGRFQIVAGERRWRAAQRAEMRKVPAVVREIADDKLLEVALIENIQRQELNPIEEANAYRKLIENIGLTQEQLSERVGKERSLIATTMRLLRLPDDVQRHIVEGKLSLSHGRALLLTEDRRVQRIAANLAVDQAISVRALESLVKRLAKDSGAEKNKVERETTKDPNVKAAETKLMRHLSTNVKIHAARKGKVGKIEIEYYGIDDLDRLYSLLMQQ
ncbi:MAG: ParB/RepB/Spo0J family partition protein [Blastocatellia bacterium]|nr:ParB/RepB/Spo0J family partition protein [Blastocatellia bacterium]